MFPLFHKYLCNHILSEYRYLLNLAEEWFLAHKFQCNRLLNKLNHLQYNLAGHCKFQLHLHKEHLLNLRRTAKEHLYHSKSEFLNSQCNLIIHFLLLLRRQCLKGRNNLNLHNHLHLYNFQNLRDLLLAQNPKENILKKQHS